MQCRQSDALEATSVTHQIKGEDGAMTGIQQVRPTLFHVFLFFIFLIERKRCFWSKNKLTVCLLFSDLWLLLMMVLPPWRLPVSGREWLSKNGTCMTTMVWAAECYFQDLEMILFCFICFWEQGGFLIHIHDHSLIGPFFWMAKVAVHTNTPAPYYGHYVHSLAPLSQGIMPLSQLHGWPLRLLPSISVVPL